MSSEMTQLKERINAWADRFNDLSLRERGLLFLALMGMLFALASTFFFAPLHLERQQLERQIATKQQQIRRFNEQVAAIANGDNQGSANQRAKLEAAQARLKALDVEFANVTNRLVPPREMARLVEQMLTKDHNLQLVKIENLPASPLLNGARSAVGAVPSGHAIYKHGMRVQVKGSYTDIRNYLHALEGLPWRMFWGEIELTTKDYPTSTVTFVVYTLSLNEGWIGV